MTRRAFFALFAAPLVAEVPPESPPCRWLKARQNCPLCGRFDMTHVQPDGLLTCGSCCIGRHGKAA